MDTVPGREYGYWVGLDLFLAEFLSGHYDVIELCNTRAGGRGRLGTRLSSRVWERD